MSELENKIAAWRKEIATALQGNEKAAGELEEHLRDQIDAFVRAGKPSDEAFTLAVRRLGKPEDLSQEFGRVRSGWWPESWSVRAVLGMLAMLMVVLLVHGVVHVAAGKWTLLLLIHVFTLTSGYLAMLSLGIIGLVALLKTWRRSLLDWEHIEFQRQMWRLTLVSIGLIPMGIVFGMAFMWQKNGGHGFWSWEKSENGALMVLISALLLWVAQLGVMTSRLSRGWALVSGIIGLGFARFWIGEAVVTAGVPIGWLWVAVITSQVAVMALRITSAKTSGDPSASKTVSLG